MTTVNLYDVLTQNNDGVAPSTTGTWTYTGSGTTGAAPLPPNPPGTYNANVSFNNVANGTYEYTYTVSGTCPSVAKVTVTKSTPLPVTNDTCGTARVLVFPYNGGQSTHNTQTLVGSCSGTATPTLSAVDLPIEWDPIEVDRDLWYLVTFDPTYPLVPIISCSFTVDGGPYGTSGVTEPLLAIYSDCGGPGSLIVAEVPQAGSKSVNIILTDIYTTFHSFYLRVASTAQNAGEFDIALTV